MGLHWAEKKYFVKVLSHSSLGKIQVIDCGCSVQRPQRSYQLEIVHKKTNCFCFFVLSLSFQCTVVHLSVKEEVLGKITPISGAPMICSRFFGACLSLISLSRPFLLPSDQKAKSSGLPTVFQCHRTCFQSLERWINPLPLRLIKLKRSTSQEASATISFKLKANS